MCSINSEKGKSRRPEAHHTRARQQAGMSEWRNKNFLESQTHSFLVLPMRIWVRGVTPPPPLRPIIPTCCTAQSSRGTFWFLQHVLSGHLEPVAVWTKLIFTRLRPNSHSHPNQSGRWWGVWTKRNLIRHEQRPPLVGDLATPRPTAAQTVQGGVRGGEVVTNVFQPARLAAADRAPPLTCTSASRAHQEFSCVMKIHGDERQRRVSHSTAACAAFLQAAAAAGGTC